MTKHLIIAAGLMILSGITLITGLVARSGGAETTGATISQSALGAHVLAADRALSPLQPDFSREGLGSNPFTMGKSGELRATRIPLPPPPPLTLPALPALPLSER